MQSEFCRETGGQVCLFGLSMLIGLRAGNRAEAKPLLQKPIESFAIMMMTMKGVFYMKLDLGESLLLLKRRDEAVPLIEAAYEFSRANLPATHTGRIRAEELHAQTRKF